MAAESGYRQIVGKPNDDLPVNPHRIVSTVFGQLMFDMPVERYRAGLPRPLNQPGRVVAQPLVSFFLLEAVLDFLLEKAKLIVDAKSVSGHSAGGQRFHEACCEPAKATISQRRVGFGIGNLTQIKAQLPGCLLRLLQKTQVEEIVAQGLANEKFCGKIQQ